MGFASYRDYLRSPLWKSIRAAKLEASPQCEICSTSKAAQVHHLRYSVDALAGKNAWPLVSTCRECHTRIEFNREGKKRPYYMAAKKTKSLLGRNRAWDEHNRISEELNNL